MYWRGDVPLTVAPFNAVDNLVLSQLAYTSFDGVKRDRLGAMARARLRPGDVQGNDRQLLELLATSRRLGVARVRRAVEQLDEERQMQFGALTLELDDGTACVVFRGTDATLIGWKEDLNMSFADEIPSQAEAVRYLNDSARDTRRPLRVMGHSKGGNLAVYSSVKCRPEVRRRIIAVYNNDGPGLSERAMAESGYARIERRIQTFLPQSSVVGILLGTAERYKVVHAEGTLGIVQHDPYAWQVRRGCFEYEPGLRRTSLLVDRTIRDWLGGMTPERRKEFVDAVYDVLHATNARTLDEIAAAWPRNSMAIISALSQLDPEKRRHVHAAIGGLISAYARNRFAPGDDSATKPDETTPPEK